MTRMELQSALERLGVREDAYSLFGGHPHDRLVIDQSGQKWAVYYSERGQEFGRRQFDTEDEACQYFLDKIMRDPKSFQKPTS